MQYSTNHGFTHAAAAPSHHLTLVVRCVVSCCASLCHLLSPAMSGLMTSVYDAARVGVEIVSPRRVVVMMMACLPRDYDMTSTVMAVLIFDGARGDGGGDACSLVQMDGLRSNHLRFTSAPLKRDIEVRCAVRQMVVHIAMSGRLL